MARPQLLSGARGVIKNGETILAMATDITVNVRHGVRQTYVIGKMSAGSIDSLSYDVDVSIGRVVPVNSGSVQDTNFDPAGDPQVTPPNNPSAFANGLEPTIAVNAPAVNGIEVSFVKAEDLNIVLSDSITGEIVASVKGCRFSGRTFGANANDVANERLNFVGIYDAGSGAAENSANTGYVVA